MKVRCTIAVIGIMSTVVSAWAYTPDIHKRSIVESAQICQKKYGLTLKSTTFAAIVKGVKEPDAFSVSSLEIIKQRIEPNSYGKQRSINAVRIAAQSIHGSPNPTRKLHSSSPQDQRALQQSVRRADSSLQKNRLDIDVYAYDTNQGLRNKMLINASQFLCVSMAHKDADQSARKFGNLLHMVGDTYSASHVQRAAPVGSPPKCGTEKIEWHFSMDLVSWKRHALADRNHEDWRFNCLSQHSAELMKLWSSGRDAVTAKKSKLEKRDVANREIRKSLRLLCEKVLRTDENVLRQPAGGASAQYSSASGTDNWRVLRTKRPDLAIQPVGLTSIEEAEEFYRSVSAKLEREGHAAEFSYPPRSMPDLCRSIIGKEPLHAALQCTPEEIELAVTGSKRVSSMWIPRRTPVQ